MPPLHTTSCATSRRSVSRSSSCSITLSGMTEIKREIGEEIGVSPNKPLPYKQHASMPGGILIITGGKTTVQAEEPDIGQDSQQGADNSVLTGGINSAVSLGISNIPHINQGTDTLSINTEEAVDST